MKTEEESNPEIVPGSLWKSGKNQDRLVLKLVGNDVCFAVRGGNALNEFETRYRHSIADFRKASEPFSKAIDLKRFEEIKERLSSWLDRQT